MEELAKRLIREEGWKRTNSNMIQQQKGKIEDLPNLVWVWPI